MHRTSALTLACAMLATGATGLAQTPAASSPAASPAASTAPAAPGAPVPDAVQKQLTADYALACAAVQDPSDKNLDAMFALYSPDFVNYDTKGNQETRAQMMASEKQQLKVFHGTDCSNTFESMTAPDAATVVVVITGKILGDMQAPDGKHDIDFSGKSEDTWKNINGTWLETQSKDLHTVIKMDGNVVQDSGN